MRRRIRPFAALALALAVAACGGVDAIDDDAAVDAGVHDDPSLVALGVSAGVLDPPFDPGVTEYRLALGLAVAELAVTPTAADPDGVDIEVAGEPAVSGAASRGLPLALGDNPVEITVTPEVGEPRVYTIAAGRGAGIAQRGYLKASNAQQRLRRRSGLRVRPQR